MQGNGENKNVEIKGSPKSPWVKIAAAVVVIAVVFFGYKAWKDGSSQPVQQAAAEPVVIVKQVEKFDASSVPSEYVGRVESIQSVSVKPQISGDEGLLQGRLRRQGGSASFPDRPEAVRGDGSAPQGRAPAG